MKAGLEPLSAFHWASKSVQSIGRPLFQAAFGFSRRVITCGLVLVTSADSR